MANGGKDFESHGFNQFSDVKSAHHFLFFGAPIWPKKPRRSIFPDAQQQSFEGGNVLMSYTKHGPSQIAIQSWDRDQKIASCAAFSVSARIPTWGNYRICHHLKDMLTPGKVASSIWWLFNMFNYFPSKRCDPEGCNVELLEWIHIWLTYRTSQVLNDKQFVSKIVWQLIIVIICLTTPQRWMVQHMSLRGPFVHYWYACLVAPYVDGFKCIPMSSMCVHVKTWNDYSRTNIEPTKVNMYVPMILTCSPLHPFSERSTKGQGTYFRVAPTHDSWLIDTSWYISYNGSILSILDIHIYSHFHG